MNPGTYLKVSTNLHLQIMDRTLGVSPPNPQLLLTGFACPDVVRRPVATVYMAHLLVRCNKQKKTFLFFKFLWDYQEVDHGPAASFAGLRTIDPCVIR